MCACGIPNWSTNDGNKPGGGDPDGTAFVPGEVDTTLQENDLWFYQKGHAIRSLQELRANSQALVELPISKDSGRAPSGDAPVSCSVGAARSRCLLRPG